MIVDVGRSSDVVGSWSHALSSMSHCAPAENEDDHADVHHLLVQHNVFDADTDVFIQTASVCRTTGIDMALGSIPYKLRLRNDSRTVVEWSTPDVGADFVRNVGRWLQRRGVEPSRSVLLHYRTGRLACAQGVCAPACHGCPREAWWSLYWLRLLDEARQHHLRACGGEYAARVWCRRPSSKICGPFYRSSKHTGGVLMLGGDAHQHRQEVVFGVWNSSLRPTTTWSMSKPPECATGRRGWTEFCNLLPKKLDVPLLGENDETSRKDVRLPDPYLYESTDVSITFESMSDYDGYSTFLTEKILKPVFGAHPFVLVCGAAGALASFRSFGFVTFSPEVDESYDDPWPEDPSRQSCHAPRRVARLIQSVTSLLESPARMRRAKAKAARNRRHFVCPGGLSARLNAQAVSILGHLA